MTKISGSKTIVETVFQEIINVCYRFPKSEWNKVRRFGGYFSYRQLLKGKKSMENAAFSLPAVQSFPNGLPIYFLTGEKYLFQTLFCIRSLSLVSKEEFKFVLIDDGSFNQPILSKLKRLLPGAVIIGADKIEQNVKERLPENHFPHLVQKRRVYPHIKKLTDIHTLPGSSWKLVLDSDMLFWKEPVELIKWLKAPNLPVNMIDSTNSYGYSINLMERLSNIKITPLINVGAIGLKSEAINWDAVEKWINGLEKEEGTSYYLEQALTAMLIGNRAAIQLSKCDYIVNPGAAATANKSGALHHYVDLSKKPYFTHLWKELMP